jgi:hypothetical protein
VRPSGKAERLKHRKAEKPKPPSGPFGVYGKNGGQLLMWNQVGKSTSLPTISRPTKPRPSKLFLSEHPHVHLHFTPTYSSWINPDRNLVLEDPARTSLRAASSNPRQISPGKSCVTSATTTKRRSLSDGATKIPPTEYDELFTFICYAALAKAIDAVSRRWRLCDATRRDNCVWQTPDLAV